MVVIGKVRPRGLDNLYFKGVGRLGFIKKWLDRSSKSVASFGHSCQHLRDG